MTEAQVHFWLVLLIFALAAQTFLLLQWVVAPYGRFARTGWGPTMPARAAWMLFESPAVLVFAAVYAAGSNARDTAPLVLLCAWQFHYVARAFVYPLRMRDAGKRIPLVIVAMALLFNILNAYVNARWISQLGHYPHEWLTSTPFAVGSVLFVVGWAINQHADTVLRRLRRRGDSHYAIPRGALYDRVSCPNYLGEILEWTGWAVATWSLAGLAFAVFTAANLLPRALATDRWYRRQFPDYPATRRAVIPYLL